MFLVYILAINMHLHFICNHTLKRHDRDQIGYTSKSQLTLPELNGQIPQKPAIGQDTEGWSPLQIDHVIYCKGVIILYPHHHKLQPACRALHVCDS